MSLLDWLKSWQQIVGVMFGALIAFSGVFVNRWLEQRAENRKSKRSKLESVYLAVRNIRDSVRAHYSDMSNPEIGGVSSGNFYEGRDYFGFGQVIKEIELHFPNVMSQVHPVSESLNHIYQVCYQFWKANLNLKPEMRLPEKIKYREQFSAFDLEIERLLDVLRKRIRKV